MPERIKVRVPKEVDSNYINSSPIRKYTSYEVDVLHGEDVPIDGDLIVPGLGRPLYILLDKPCAFLNPDDTTSHMWEILPEENNA